MNLKKKLWRLLSVLSILLKKLFDIIKYYSIINNILKNNKKWIIKI